MELLIDLPESELQAGDRGAIVEKHSDHAYEIEFTNSEGETLALHAFAPEQFIVVWQSSTKNWVPLTDRISATIRTLPEDRQEQVLKFARLLTKTSA